MSETSLPEAPRNDFFSNLWLGLRILASECKWMAIQWLHDHELRQTRKRLRQESAILGEALAGLALEKGSPLDLKVLDPETDLALKQVQFLSKEIEFIQLDMARRRKDFVARRMERLNLAPSE